MMDLTRDTHMHILCCMSNTPGRTALAQPSISHITVEAEVQLYRCSTNVNSRLKASIFNPDNGVGVAVPVCSIPNPNI